MLVGYGGMQNVVMIAEAQRLRDSYEHALRQWLRYYNEDRPHGAIGNKPPILSDAITYYSVTIPPTYSVVDLDDQSSQQGGIRRCAKPGDNAVHFG